MKQAIFRTMVPGGIPAITALHQLRFHQQDSDRTGLRRTI